MTIQQEFRKWYSAVRDIRRQFDGLDLDRPRAEVFPVGNRKVIFRTGYICDSDNGFSWSNQPVGTMGNKRWHDAFNLKATSRGYYLRMKALRRQKRCRMMGG